MSNKTFNTPHAKNLVGDLNDETKTIQEIIENLSNQIDTLSSTKQNNLTFDSLPVANSENPVKSGGIYTFTNDLIDSKTSIENVWVTTGANAAYTLTPAQKKNYFFGNGSSLSSLTITGFPPSNEEVIIYLQTGSSGCKINLPSGTSYINSLSLSANTWYVCSMLNNVFISVPTLYKS